jgi:hypothetical protein
MLPSLAKALIAAHFGMLGSFVSLYSIEAGAWALFWALLLRFSTVQLRPDGIKIYSLWWLPWSDVTRVMYRKIFGLPYFQVRRRRGFSWWIPLYYVGDRELAQAILHAAPPDHPFRSVPIPS